MSDAREFLAEQAHTMWAHWMRHMFGECTSLAGDAMAIQEHNVRRWARLARTPYADLTEGERESDREQADRMRAALAASGLAIVPVEPTEAMVTAGIYADQNIGVEGVWRHMLRTAQETGT